jgi:hypothetical protein
VQPDPSANVAAVYGRDRAQGVIRASMEDYTERFSGS